jgi:hypothetical protein
MKIKSSGMDPMLEQLVAQVIALRGIASAALFQLDFVADTGSKSRTFDVTRQAARTELQRITSGDWELQVVRAAGAWYQARLSEGPDVVATAEENLLKVLANPPRIDR